MTLKEGYRLQEFEIKKKLGQGGFGITYLAFDTRLKKDVAIKEFFPKDLVNRDEQDNSVSLQKIEGEDSEDKQEISRTRYKHFLKKFEQEAQIMASLDHPNIVKVTRYFEENNTGYFVMNYIKGESLKKYIERVGKLPQDQILEIIIPLLEGLKHVHNADFLHRDIAPDNIFLAQNGKTMLLDFGAAKSTLIDATGKEVSIGVIKKSYSAPEQFYDDSIHTIATDIYSIGAVIVFCLTGKTPPPAPKRSNEKSDSLIALLEEYNSQCTQGFIKAIAKAMNLQAKNRFQEVIELQKSLTTKRVTLKRFILKNDKRLTQKEILNIVNPLLDKLEVLHNKGSTHSNISPENIYIKDGNVIELGRPMERVEYSSNSLTAIRNIGYSAPEQYSSESEDTNDTDLYSVGAVMFFMITSKIPSESTKRLTEVYSKKEDSVKRILKKYSKKYSNDFLNTVLKAMELRSDDRFQTIGSLREALNSKKITPPPLPIKKIIVSIVVFIILGTLYLFKDIFMVSPYVIPKTVQQQFNNTQEEIKNDVVNLDNKRQFLAELDEISLDKCSSQQCIDEQNSKLNNIAINVKKSLLNGNQVHSGSINECTDDDVLLGLCEKNKRISNEKD